MVFGMIAGQLPRLNAGAFLTNPVSGIILGAAVAAAVVAASVMLFRRNRG